MVAVLEQADEIENLIEWLQRQGPPAAKVLHHVICKKENLVDCIVVVDKWPDPRAVFIKPSPVEKVVHGNKYSIHATSEEACRALFANDGVFEWDKPMILGGTDKRFASVIEEEAKKNGCYIEFIMDFFLFVYKGHNSPERSLPSGFEYVTLSSKHAEKIIGSWKYKGIEQSGYIEFLVENFPSIGVVDKKTGQLVAWSLVKHHGSCGMTHVEPEYRRKGLASCITQRLANVLISHGRSLVFVHSEIENDASMKMHQMCGYELWPTEIVWIKTQPHKKN